MAKKSKDQQDDHKREEEFVDLPEDRLEQIMPEGSQEEEPETKTENKSSLIRRPKQTQAKDDAKMGAVDESESSQEDLLADVRRALADEEVVEEPKKGFFGRIRQRFGKSSESEKEDSETAPELVEIETSEQEDVSGMSDDLQNVLDDLVVDTKPEEQPAPKSKPKSKKKRPERDVEEEISIQEFFADLEALADVDPEGGLQAAIEGQQATTEEAQEVEAAKVPKLPVKSETEDEVDLEAVRELALEDYDETKIEVEERKQSIQEEVRQTVRELKPVERFLLYGVGIVTVVILLFSGIYLITNSISVPTPEPTAEIDLSQMVYPTRMTLPGGWEFALGEGRVVEGEWTPQNNRAEWLVGTEISRWVALPWSLQLEAVLRTLTAEDQIELTMSNFEVLTFDVYSIQKISMEQLLATDPTKPALVVVLYNDEEEDGTYWTVTALPARGE